VNAEIGRNPKKKMRYFFHKDIKYYSSHIRNAGYDLYGQDKDWTTKTLKIEGQKDHFKQRI